MKVNKTIKLFMGGNFPRTESGRIYPEYISGTKEVYANICQASRKDFRNAIELSKAALPNWKKMTAYLRGQIIYRMAEMCEGKRSEFVELFQTVLGRPKNIAEKMVDEAIDSFVYFAGFTDKYQQIIGSINPVAGPYMNYTNPVPVGVVVLINNDEFNFKKLITNIVGVIASGNSLTVIMPKECSSILAPLAEVFATSDLPKGVVNLLTGSSAELAPHIATHMDVKSISFQRSDRKMLSMMKFESADNMKRVIPFKDYELSLGAISDFLECKTVWHPLEI